MAAAQIDGRPELAHGGAAVDDPRTAERLMRWVGVAMFLLGSTTLLATLPLPDPNSSDHPAIRIVAALLAIGALLVALLRPGRRWVSRFGVIYGVLLVSALMAVTRPIEATPFFYLWPMVFSAYFCSRREVVADLVLLWATLGLALFVFSDDPMKPVMFLGVGVSVTLTTVVVKLLAEHITSVIGALAKAADTDYLTGLLNRRAFDVEFAEQYQRALRNRLPLSLAMFDLDHFKQINDRFGHSVGDQVLIRAAELLCKVLRASDIIVRSGGEEFLVLMPQTEANAALAGCERIRRAVRDEPWHEMVAGLSQTTSVGLATANNAVDLEALVKLADQRLYDAKSAGRDCVVAA